MENDRPEQESQAGGQDPSLPPPLPPMDLPPPLPESDAQQGLPEEAPPDESAFPGPPPLPNQEYMAESGGFAGSSAPPPPDPHPASPVLPPFPNNGQALGWASLIVGLLSLPIGGCCAFLCAPIGLFGILGGIVGAVLGFLGMRKASEVGQKNVPALIGIIVSIIAVVASIAWFALVGLAIIMDGM